MKRFSHCLGLSLILLLAGGAWGYTDHDCIRCHSYEGSARGFRVNISDYRSTVHGRVIGCLDCHEDIEDNKHIIEGSEKVDCQRCHEQQNLHARDRRVKCAACHTHHTIYEIHDPRASVHWKNLRDTCGKCHPKESQHTDFLSVLSSIQIALHPKEDFGRISDMGMCVGCHQGQAAHGEDAPVNDQDCHKCHMPLAENSFILGYAHKNADWSSKPVNFIAGYINIAVILIMGILLVGGLFTILKKRLG